MGWRVPPWQVKATEGEPQNELAGEEEGGSHFEVVAHWGDVDDESVLGSRTQPQDGSGTNEERADVQRSFAIGRHLAQQGDDMCQMHDRRQVPNLRYAFVIRVYLVGMHTHHHMYVRMHCDLDVEKMHKRRYLTVHIKYTILNLRKTVQFFRVCTSSAILWAGRRRRRTLQMSGSFQPSHPSLVGGHCLLDSCHKSLH